MTLKGLLVLLWSALRVGSIPTRGSVLFVVHPNRGRNRYRQVVLLFTLNLEYVVTAKEIYLAALALTGWTSTTFWGNQRKSNLSPESYLNSLKGLIELEKEIRTVDGMALEVRNRLSFWVQFFTKKGQLDRGYCQEIAGNLGDALASMNLISGWTKSCYEIWELYYQPQGCSWRIDHTTIPIQDNRGRTYLLDIPMKEYAYFNPATEKWMAKVSPTFEVHVIHSKEDFLAAYPGMTEKEAEVEVKNLLDSSLEFPCIFAPEALEELSNGRYTNVYETLTHSQLEKRGQETLSF